MNPDNENLDLLKSEAWSEQCFFVECPHCNSTITLDYKVYEGEEVHDSCAKCKNDFFVCGKKESTRYYEGK